MENWRSKLNEMFNENCFFPYENWNKELGIWCKEWSDEAALRSGVATTVTQSSRQKRIAVSLHGGDPFIICLNYCPQPRTERISLSVKYTMEYHPLRKFKAILKGEDHHYDEEENYSWFDESLELKDGPILEKDFVLENITYALRKWIKKQKEKEERI